MANTKSSSGGKSSGGTAKKKTGTAKNGSASTNKSPQSRKKQPEPKSQTPRWAGAAVCAVVGIFLALGYFDIHAIVIDALVGLVKGLLGYGYWLMPPMLIVAAVALIPRDEKSVAFRVTSALLAPVLFGSVWQLLFCRASFDLSGSFSELIKALYSGGKLMGCGGLLSGLLAVSFEEMFSVYGAFPVLLAAFIFFLLCSVSLTPRRIMEIRNERLSNRPEPEPEPEIIEPASAKAAVLPRKRRNEPVIDIPLGEKTDAALPEKSSGSDAPLGGFVPDISLAEEVIAPEPPIEPMPASESEPVPDRAGFLGRRKAKTPAEKLAEMNSASGVQTDFPEPEVMHISAAPPASEKASRVEVEAEKQAVAQEIENAKDVVPEYEFPPIDLLRKSQLTSVDAREEINANRERLETALRSFGVSANIVNITRGPTVTRYDLELDAGVKLAKITNLSGDLALALGVMNVRIAPIPDKISTVGIEVPNKLVSIVALREVIDSAAFKSSPSNLTFALGKDISGECIVGNIAKLPHLLIAGTTGSGKSVCLNCLLLSLLYKSTPAQVRLIMIDPKMVELGIYNGIPHLLVPVVTDPKKAAGALQWGVVEMLKRYRLFSEVGVRDLAGFNAHQQKNGAETIPQIVVVVDELADLMLVASKDVEESICRIAQMGRAAGIHLIIATQRPSADVITGLMKANIPSRIAFAVSSALESRIILDQQGAEKLIGMGDMLYSPLGIGKPVRIQGAFVSDEEREDVIDFIKRDSAPDYSDDILAEIDKAAEDKNAAPDPEETAPAENHFDELLPQAVDVIFETKQASVSMLQRRLKLGYSRAARIIDQMEELGVVGPFEGSKPRQVLITRQQWQEMQLISGTAPTERFTAEMEFGTDEDNGVI